jgi:tetratricopeptide (TPR) repeat protein
LKIYRCILGFLTITLVLAGNSVFAATDANFDDAVAALEARKFDQSIELFTGIIDSGELEASRLAEAHAYRGYARYFSGHSEAAIEDYSIALELDPAKAEVRHALVAALAAAGNFTRALAEADRAVEQNPSDNIAYGNRCDLRRIMKRFDAALADCNKAIELAPEFAYSWMERAKLYRDWGRHDKARSDVKTAYRLWPQHPAIRAMAENYGLLAE